MLAASAGEIRVGVDHGQDQVDASRRRSGPGSPRRSAGRAVRAAAAGAARGRSARCRAGRGRWRPSRPARPGPGRPRGRRASPTACRTPRRAGRSARARPGRTPRWCPRSGRPGRSRCPGTGSISNICRAASTALFTPIWCRPARSRLRLDTLRVSKSASLKAPATPSWRQGQRGAVADRQADDADPLVQQPALLGPVDLAAVAVGADQAELLAGQHVHQAAGPRVPGPGAVVPGPRALQLVPAGRGQGLLVEGAAGVAGPDQLLQLGVDGVGDFADRAGVEQRGHRHAVVVPGRGEQDRLPAVRVRGADRGEAARRGVAPDRAAVRDGE